jgi:hypothetical protein
MAKAPRAGAFVFGILLSLEMEMDNVLQDMVHRLRAIELVLRAQNELLTRMLAQLEQIAGSKMEATAGRPKDEERVRRRA